MKKKILLVALLATVTTNVWAQEMTDTTHTSIISHVENWYAEHMNYATITALMAV